MLGLSRNVLLARSGSRMLLLRCGVLLTMLCVCGCRAEAPWPLWDAYSARFIDGQGRVIDHTAGDRTTSEGQAYAMFFALVVGDRSRFDKLLDWTESNLANGDLTTRLPAWSWGKADDGAWRVLDDHSAADADLWMAYTLCEAGRLWRAPRYDKLGRLMAARIAQQEIVLMPSLGAMLLPGPQGYHPDPQSWFANPSYLPAPLLTYFARQYPQAPWRDVLASTPTIIHTQGGFAMDWVKVDATGVHPSVNPSRLVRGPVTDPATGSYDAIRVYLWAGMTDSHTEGAREILAETRGMAAYLQSHSFPPLEVDPDGAVKKADAPVGFSAAVIPYLHAMGMKAQEKAQMDRLVALKDDKSGLYGKDVAYYDQNLALFAIGFTEGRFKFEKDGQLHLKWK